LVFILQHTYEIQNTNLLRTKWISYVGQQWKGFKSNRIICYIYGESGDKNS